LLIFIGPGITISKSVWAKAWKGELTIQVKKRESKFSSEDVLKVQNWMEENSQGIQT